MRSCVTVFLVAAGIAADAAAGSMTLQPSKDNTLYFSTLGDVSNGQGPEMFAGTMHTGAPRRALVAFDVSAIPAAATIDSVTLTLYMSRTIVGPQNVRLHRVAADWGEGASVAGGGGGGGGAGGPAEPGDATWLHRFYSTDFWTSPGGDFAATPSASASVDTVGFYSWNSAQMVADVQSWLASGNNFGWILITNEATFPTSKRFETRESISTLRPKLRVVFRDPTDALPPLASKLFLAPATPNPFNPATSLRFELPHAGHARLTVHDVHGRLVATLVDAPLDAGPHHTVWDGRTAHGETAASGVYIARLESASGTRTRRLVLAK